MKNRNTTKLVTTIVSMVSALCLLAVGVFATLTNFQVAIANQLNLKFDAVEGTLYATRVGDVAGTDRTTSKVLSESTTATDWLKVYDGTTTKGVQNDALTSIQEKVDFISNDKIKEIVNGGRTYVAITYYFYYVLPEGSTSNNVTLTAPAVTDKNVVVSYSYTKATNATLPTFDSVTSLTDGGSVTVNGGEHLFIKAEAKVDLSKSVKIETVDWNYTLNFGIAPQPIKADNGVYTTAEPINGNYYYYVELGEYPQTAVEDTATVSALNALGDSAKTGRTFTVGASDDSAQTAHVEYTYNGAKYVKVASAVVHSGSKFASGKDSRFASGTAPTKGNTYWFKVEPIKWFLLEAYSTTKTAYTGSTTNLRVISEQLLTANVMFDADTNPWNTSNIRDWLNNSFYTSAFSASDKGYISKNITRYFGTSEHATKDDYTVTTGGNTTEDNVWLISYYEAVNTYYGANAYLNKKSRAATPTDFAVVNNVTMFSNGRGYYWLRSAGNAANRACLVSNVGSLSYFNSVSATTLGVRPALTITL